MKVIFFVSTLLLSAIGAPDESVAVSSWQRCNPIGRITSGRGGNFSEGDIVCLGQQLESPRAARMLCFSDQAEVSLPNSTLTVSRNLCGNSSLSNRDCAETQCFYPKGSGADSRLAIIQPELDVVSGRTPSIAWSLLSDATSYQVTVSGPNLIWSRTISTSHLAYPTDEEALSAGSAYSINVTAFDGTRPVARTSVVINTLGNNVASNISDQKLIVPLPSH